MKSDLSATATKWCYAIIILLSLSMQWYGHRCGLLLTPDSANYVSASQSLKADGNFLSPDGSLYTYWPPLFPATLALFDSPERAALWMYAIVTILIGILSVLILNRILENNLYKVMVLFLTLSSVQFIMISVFLWSEMNFLLLVLGVTFCSLNYNKSRKHFTGLLIVAFLMCLQRNAGVFILAGVCGWVLLDKTLPLKIQVTRSAIIFIAGISGLVAWNIYLSVIIESGFFFYKHEFFVHALENFSSVSIMLTRIFIPVSEWIANVIGIAMIVALIVQIKKSNAVVRLIGLLVLCYGLGLVCMFRLDIYDMDRFLSIILLFIFLLVFQALEKLSSDFTKPRKIVLAVILLLWMAYPVYRTVTNLQHWNESSCSIAR
ncbi:MAG TPA: hypothetical protein VFM90_02170 [Cyclobacteriaceae bacterium]|nr:hypothetical protein [Cyclobacteriaceae bacterium]